VYDCCIAHQTKKNVRQMLTTGCESMSAVMSSNTSNCRSTSTERSTPITPNYQKGTMKHMCTHESLQCMNCCISNHKKQTNKHMLTTGCESMRAVMSSNTSNCRSTSTERSTLYTTPAFAKRNEESHAQKPAPQTVENQQTKL
jgi:flagellar basal body rod protein FlgC